MRRGALAMLIVAIVTGRSAAQEGVPGFDDTAPAALAGSIRGFLLDHLPPVLLEDDREWGKTELVTRGLEWKGAGKMLPQKQKSHKNHGVWKRVKVTALNPRDTLIFDLRNVRQAGPNTVAFTVFLSFDTQIDYEQQNWRRDVRMYAGSARAKMRVRLTLDCELSSRTVKSTGFLPDIIFTLRVTKSDLGFDNLNVEHIAGVGGDLAEALGEGVRGWLKLTRPNLERSLLEKANTAIIKAADNKQVRVNMSKLFQSKGLLP